MEWENEEAFQKRPQLPCNEVIKVNNRHYGLLKTKCPGASLPAFLELVRHKPPVFKSRDELEMLLKELARFDYTIALGHVRRDNEWVGLDGTVLPWINNDVQEYRSTFMVSVYNQCLVAHHGKLKSDYSSAAILVELP